MEDLHGILEHLEVQHVDLIILQDVLGLPTADPANLSDKVPITQGLTSVLTQPLVDVLLYVCWVEKEVLRHLLMVEVGKTLELLDSQRTLLFIVRIREESHRLVVLVPHYVQYTAFLWVWKVNLLSLVLVIRLR